METKRRAKAPLPMSSFRGGRVGGASHPSLPTTHGWNHARRNAAHEARRLTCAAPRDPRTGLPTPQASSLRPAGGGTGRRARTASLTGLGGGYQDLRERPEVFDGCVIRHVDPRARATLAARAHIATTGHALVHRQAGAPGLLRRVNSSTTSRCRRLTSHGRAGESQTPAASRVAGPVPFHGPTCAAATRLRTPGWPRPA